MGITTKKFNNPVEANQELTSAFGPTTPEQTAAIKTASDLVPSTPSKVIPVDSIKPAVPIDLSGTNVPTPTGTSDVAGATTANDKFNADQQKMMDRQNTPESEDQTALNLLEKALGQNPLEGQGQATIESEQNAGIPQFEEAIAENEAELGTQIAEYNQLAQEYEAGKAKLEAEAGAKGVTRQGVLQGQQGALDRQKATELNVKAAEIGYYKLNL